ncbi:amino acid transporter [Cryobacterium sp. MP_M5]|uniref:APC family permease n=1 Tax=unclassified Cryobacterium TaxID=2649013 RepID=UPI0018CB6179|nr:MULTISPECIES: APC family permease [unclassified Cryobacterium]MBG6056677.1 amino acid transporter [Cryobacterium sp. MP_M3]MEC5176349.1 amino acid transporter [Cryobacterium sp. MP_M5]
MTDTVPPQPDQVDSKGLKGGALGLVSSIVVGMASTAPAYSLAASLGFIVASGGALLAGVKAPGIVLLAFIPMYLIAVAYQELNKAEPDCGTTFTWASRAFGPITGWLGGWGIIAADVIVMANLAQVAGSYSFVFLGDLGLTGVADLANDQFWSTVAGVLWITVMTYICYRGIELSARIQYWLLAIEVIVLVMFAVYALVRVYSGSAESYSLTPSLDWFNPFTLDFGTVIAPAVLTAVFIYWGWDTAVSVNEETEDPGTTPGRAAVISTFLLLGTYALVTVAAIAFAGVGTDGIGLGNDANSADVFTAIGPALFGNSVLGNIAMLLLAASILTSASASTQTTILPTARTALSMAVYRALPERFARIHPRFLTPTWSTVAMGAVSIGFYVLFTLISPRLLGALIGSVGLMIAFYYGLTGYACVWFYRKTLWSSFRNVIMRGVFPLLGGLMLTAAFGYGLAQYALPDWLQDDNGNNVTIFGIGAVAVVGIGAMLLGAVLMLVWWRVHPPFFRGTTLPRRTDGVVPQQEA